jgi:hypothetical protein
MISQRDLYKEIEKAEDSSDKASTEDLLRILVKLGTLNLKLQHNIRSNMVRMMKKAGIEITEPTDKPART